jgi:hypothetical protein
VGKSSLSDMTTLSFLVTIGDKSERLVSRKMAFENQELKGNVEDMKKLSYRPFRRCIYCGETNNLQREHIFPFGLSGLGVLPKASCPKCAEITGRFEKEVLRGPMWAVRVYRKLRSRRKHKDAPQMELLRIRKGSEEQEVKLSLSEYPILLCFPVFSPPGFILPSGYEKGIRIRGLVTISFGADLRKVLLKYGGTEVVMKQDYDHVAFARMLAKIAYAYAVAEGATALIKGSSLVLPAIMGKKDDVGKWVGTLDGPYKKFKGVLHRILLHKDTNQGLLIAEIQLFADSATPNYGIILGKLK